MTCDIPIGNSRFHDMHWKGPFYPEKTPATKLLGFYVHHFDTVDLNNGFYRVPPVRAVDGWPKPLVLSRISRFTAP
jgi:uncharacterized protein YecE (DUF72 family)